jgi:hypothetical protein
MTKSLKIPKGLGIFKLLVIVLSVPPFTTSDNPFGIFKLLVIVLSVLRFTASDNPFGIFKLLVIVLSVSRKSKDRQHNDQKLEDTKGVIRSLKSKNRQQAFGHFAVCPSIYYF